MSGLPDPVGWGILATGKIARSFAADLALVPGARLAAVGSRSPQTAQAFASEYGDGDTRTHGSYEALVADPEVEVVYVATPTPSTSTAPGPRSRRASTCCARSR